MGGDDSDDTRVARPDGLCVLSASILFYCAQFRHEKGRWEGNITPTRTLSFGYGHWPPNEERRRRGSRTTKENEGRRHWRTLFGAKKTVVDTANYKERYIAADEKRISNKK